MSRRSWREWPSRPRCATRGGASLSPEGARASTALVLLDQFGPGFSPASFAYRPGLGPRRAAEALAAALPATGWVVLADIEKFFDNVDHAILFAQLRAGGLDDGGAELLRRWLRASSVIAGHSRAQAVKGLPQGAPIAPMLANIYLTPFDHAVEQAGWTHVRYADDFVVVAGSEAEATVQLDFLRRWLRSDLNLAIKDAKTQMASVADGFPFVGFWLDGGGLSLPADRERRFKAAIGEILAAPSRQRFPAAAKRHNHVVAGWRNYYGAASKRLDYQFRALDAWRRLACTTFLKTAQLDDGLLDLGFESLAPQAPLESLGGYPEWQAAADEQGVSIEVLAGTGLVNLPRQSAPERRAVSTSSSCASLRVAERALRQTPVMFDDGELRVPAHGSYLTMARQVLVVRLKKRTVFECPMNLVDHVAIEASGVAVSSRVVNACATNRIPIVFCTSRGLPTARLVPARTGVRPGLVDAQAAARGTALGTAIAAEIIAAKIRNQRTELLRASKYRGRGAGARESLKKAADTISRLGTVPVDTLGEPLPSARAALLLREARAAAWYWQAVATLVPERLQFDRRRGRGARDPVNILFNYTYWHLFQRVWRAVERCGLNPFLGLIHTGRREAPGLVLDLMEEFRQPVADRVVLAVVGRGTVVHTDAEGRLSLRSRRLVTDAFVRALARRDRGITFADRVRHQAAVFALAAQQRQRYIAYRSRW